MIPRLLASTLLRRPTSGHSLKMDADLAATINAINASPTRAVVYTSGGASECISWLQVIPGASATVLETRTPYSREAFLDTVGAKYARTIQSFASPTAARALARAAFQRAVSLAPPGTRVVGIAAVCALTTKPARRGADRAHVTSFAAERVAEYTLRFASGRSRAEQEHLAARLALQALADDAGIHGGSEHAVNGFTIAGRSALTLVRVHLRNGDTISGPDVRGRGDAVGDLLRGDVKFAEFCRKRIVTEATCANVLLPGSFNPVHRGHRRLLEAAVNTWREICGPGVHLQGAFEISAENPDKPAMVREEVLRRVGQFLNGDIPVIVSNTPLFKDKAMLYPGAVFVVGFDTAVRLVMPKYYGGFDSMMEALGDMRERGCSVLVAARVGADGNVGTLRDVDIPAGVRGLFKEIPENVFREDISSTQIRAIRSEKQNGPF